MPEKMTALSGSCLVIPCHFTHPRSHHPQEVVWYQYVSRGYPLVYSNSKGDVIDKFRGRTELVRTPRNKDCSLKINRIQKSDDSEKIYPWLDRNQKTYTFYDKTVALEVRDVDQPNMMLSGEPKEGATIQVKCTVFHTCPPSPPSLSFGGLSGALQETHTEEGQGRWRASLSITWEVRSEDHGRAVTCNVVYPGGLKTSGTITLSVAYAPRSVKVTGDRDRLLPGNSVSLSCQSRANPPASPFHWYQINGSKTTVLRHTSKSISVSVLDQDENLFHCTATNSIGSANSSSAFVVNYTEYKPSISTDSQCSYHRGLMSCLCLARARPQASVQWTVNGRIQKGNASQEHDLQKHVITGVWTSTVTTENVTVSCIVTNIHGSDEHSLKVLVEVENGSFPGLHRPFL